MEAPLRYIVPTKYDDSPTSSLQNTSTSTVATAAAPTVPPDLPFTKHRKAVDATKLFQGVSIYVNGYTNPPLAQIKRIVGQHGGFMQHYLNRATVTHIVAANLPIAKLRDILYALATPASLILLLLLLFNSPLVTMMSCA